MKWFEEIKAYIPRDEREQKDRDYILKCYERFGDILTRENREAHLTSSGFIINRDRTKTLMVHHNIYNAWTWTGGHADGEEDLLMVALKEAREETGVEGIEPYSTEIVSLDVLSVKEHIKRGEIVPEHLHLSIAYILMADENEKLSVKPDENSQVMWIPLEKIWEITGNEPHMQRIYKKIIDRIKK